MSWIRDWAKKDLVDEVLRAQEIIALIWPRTANFPDLPNIDYHVRVQPLGACMGGDLAYIVNFSDHGLAKRIDQARTSGNRRLESHLSKNRDSLGIMIADASGHMIADGIAISNLYAALDMAIDYELDMHGEITAGLFTRLNEKFVQWLAPDFIRRKPYVTFLYGEIHDDGRFRYVNGGHPHPIYFSSADDKIVKFAGRREGSTALGVDPAVFRLDLDTFGNNGEFLVSEIQLLGKGDILLLYTDGLTEQASGEMSFSDTKLEEVLREHKSGTASEIYDAVWKELHAYCPPDDDVTIAVIKKS